MRAVSWSVRSIIQALQSVAFVARQPTVHRPPSKLSNKLSPASSFHPDASSIAPVSSSFSFGEVRNADLLLAASCDRHAGRGCPDGPLLSHWYRATGSIAVGQRDTRQLRRGP